MVLFFLLLLALLSDRAHGSCVYALRRGTPKKNVVYQVTVRGAGDAVLGRLEIGEREEVADAVYSFALDHKLSLEARLELMEKACPEAVCTRKRALIYENAVRQDAEFSVKLRIWEDQDPEDAIADWARLAGVEDWVAESLATEICGPIAKSSGFLWICRSHRGLLATVSIDLDGRRKLDFEIFQNEEAADAALRFAKIANLKGYESRDQVIDVARQRGAVYTRKEAIIFEASPIRNINGSVETDDYGVPKRLVIFEGTEPADAAWFFFEDVASRRLLTDEICDGTGPPRLLPRKKMVKCLRRRAILRHVPVRGPYGDKKQEVLVGVLDVLDEAEAYDLAYAFSSARGCDGKCDFYRQLAASLCSQGIQCTRQKAIAYRRLISDDDLKDWPSAANKNELVVWEDQQVVDSVRQLWRDRGGGDLKKNRELRRALSIGLCRSDEVPKGLCKRAEEVVARVYVEKPSATKRISFNYTRPYEGTVFDFGVVSWGGSDGLQALGARNDSEAHRRGVIRGMKALKFDGELLKDDSDLQQKISAKVNGSNGTVAADFDFLVVDESERRYPDAIEVFEDQTFSDAVYEFCGTKALLQPNYTAAGVQQSYLEALCRSVVSPEKEGKNCETYAPRAKVFDLQFTRDNLGHTFRYYAEDWEQPCKASEAQGSSSHGGENQEVSCAAQHAARAFCARFGRPLPPNCETDLAGVIADRLSKAATDRWSDKATPDGPDLYAALGVPRDADNDTIIEAYVALSDDLSKPFETLKAQKDKAESSAIEVTRARLAARALLRRANATLAFARAHLQTEKARIDDARSNVKSRTTPLRKSLEALFQNDDKRIPFSVATKRLDATTVDALKARGLIVESKRKRDSFFDLTILGEEAMKEDDNGGLDWSTLEKTIGQARGGGLLAASDAAMEVLIPAARQRADLALRILRVADRAAQEANATVAAIDEPLADLSKRAFALHHAYETLTDATNRDFYDRPCRPVFGACCVRDAPDGGMRITCGS